MLTPLFYSLLEWELNQKDGNLLNERDLKSCRESLTKHLKDDLVKSLLLDVYIADMSDIYVGRATLKIRFALRRTCSPNVDTLSETVQNCLNKNNELKCFVRKGKISSG